MSYRLEPHGLLQPRVDGAGYGVSGGWRGGVYPGWGGMRHGWVGTREGYTGTHPDQSQDQYIELFLALSPTHGQMKVNLRYLMRFPKMGPQIDLI